MEEAQTRRCLSVLDSEVLMGMQLYIQMWACTLLATSSSSGAVQLSRCCSALLLLSLNMHAMSFDD